MLSFLGLTGYSRNYIPNYTGLTQSLRNMIKDRGMRNLNALLQWHIEAETDFIHLKQELATAADLAVPDYTEPIFLDVSGTEWCTVPEKRGRQTGAHVCQCDARQSGEATAKMHTACSRPSK